MEEKYGEGTFLYNLEKALQTRNKKIRLENRKAYIINKYKDCVEKYKNFMPGDYPNLDNPFLYYRAYDNGLYQCNNNQVDFLKNIDKAFGHIKHSENYSLEIRLAKRMYVLLKAFGPKWDDSFFHITEYYFFKYNLSKQNKNFLTNGLWSSFLISNENLCYINVAPFCIQTGKAYLLPIDADLSIELFKSNELPVPTTCVRKALFNTIKKEFNFPQPDSRVNVLKDKIPIINLDNHSDSIYYRLTTNNNHLCYNDIAINYNSIQNAYTISRSKLIFREYINYNSISHNLIKKTVPKNIATYLYNLTEGDYSCLNKISCLIADIMTFHNVHKKLNIVFSSQDNLILFKDFIKAASSSKANYISYALKNLGQRKSIQELIANKANAMKALLIDDYIEKTDSSSYKFAKEIIKGKKVFYKDVFADKINYINSLALIRMTDNPDEINSYRNHLKDYINIIFLPKETTIPKFIPSSEDLNWLCIPFALHGLNLIYKRSNEKRPKELETINESDPIIEFFNAFCEIEPKAVEPKTALHKKYKLFYMKKFGGDTTLNSAPFNAKIEEYLLDNQIKYETGQFAHTSGSNPQCFRGFKLNQEKLNEFIKSSSSNDISTKYEQFYDYLLSLNHLIPQELINDN